MSAFKRRQLLSYLAAAGAGGVVGFAAGRAEARKPHVAPGPGGRYIDARVSVTLEDPYGVPFADYWSDDSRYVAGELGERYNIRVTNYAAHRVEAVVSVDGRDVVSGELGDFVEQRGYVIPAYGSVLIDGFRRSMSEVAAFRFSSVGASYSARRGTAQHTGVIGVAVFDERPAPRSRKPRPVAPEPYPYRGGSPYPYPSWNEQRRQGHVSDEDAAAADEVWGGRRGGATAPSAPSSSSKRAPSGRTRSSGEGAAPSRDASGRGGLGTAGPRPNSGSGKSGRPDYADPSGSAPSRSAPPREEEHLGTQYGESRYSRVREVSFRRRSKNKPDALLTLYYDSYEALRRRGIIVEPPPRPYAPEPEPFPERRFAPPPPPRRY